MMRSNTLFKRRVLVITTMTLLMVAWDWFVVELGSVVQNSNDADFLPSGAMPTSLLLLSMMQPFFAYAAPLESNQDLFLKIKNICSSKNLRAPNIPPNMLLDVVVNGAEIDFVSQVCLTQKDPQQCDQDMERYEQWLQSEGAVLFEVLDDVRVNKKPDQNERNSVNLRSLTSPQRDKFFKINEKIGYLLNLHETYTYSNQVKMGKCNEQASYALFKLLKLQANFKMQLVEVEHPVAGNHYFIFIDSRRPDVEIKNNPEEALAYLKKLNQGFICDKWNRGYFSSFEDNKLMLYKAPWPNLKVTSFDLNFDFTGLPQYIVNYFTKILNTMKLTPRTQREPLISFFDHSPANTPSNVKHVTPSLSPRK